MDETANQIEAHIDRTRERLGSNLRELEDRVEAATDWREHFRERPHVFLGAALIGGMVLAGALRSKSAGRPLSVAGVNPAVRGHGSAQAQARKLLNNVQGALIGVATAKIKDYIGEIVPGFDDHFAGLSCEPRSIRAARETRESRRPACDPPQHSRDASQHNRAPSLRCESRVLPRPRDPHWSCPMKAVCWHGTGDVRVDTVADPTIQDPRDIVIKITSTAICGSDLHLFNGFQPTMEKGNGAHAAAWSDAFAAHGRHHPPEQVRPLIGKGGDKLLRELASLDDESGEGKRIAEARVEIFRNRYLPTLEPTRGAAAFVEWLLESRLTVVVATSAKDDEVKALLTICGGQALVRDATTSDDAERSKPDPDILNAALEKSGSSPDRAIMIGDTPYDIEAARRAGLATIAFRCGGWDDAALRDSIAIYDDPKQLLDRLGHSPFYTETS